VSVSGVSRFSKVSEKQERAFVSSEQPWNSLGKLLSIQRGLEPVLSAVITLQGVGVLLAETKKAAESIIQAFMGLNANIIVQEYIQEAKGADIRCLVIGDKVVASMKRFTTSGLALT